MPNDVPEQCIHGGGESSYETIGEKSQADSSIGGVGLTALRREFWMTRREERERERRRSKEEQREMGKVCRRLKTGKCGGRCCTERSGREHELLCKITLPTLQS